uniref:leucine-rich repeat protein n=1 Tax=Prevotella sp. TaxID=59823 RepID=UPI00402714AA
MKKIFQYIMLAVVTIVMASCTSDIEETTTTTGKNNVQLVVGEFPAFGDSQTRAIGTPDEGKTSWAEGDELLLEMTSKTLGTKYAAFTYNGSSWELTSGELSYKEDEVPTFPHVYYAPNYKWEAGKLVLKEGKVAGTDEYIEGKANITPNGQAITVEFSKATRNYSRLRIATMPNKPITVTIDRYTPAGSSDMEQKGNYTLTSDEKGNACLYGTFENNSEVTVKYRGATLKTYKFSKETENAKSYALDATVISANSAEEIKSAIKQEVANSKTAIILNLASDAGDNEFKTIREAFKNVRDATIDLTLIGCKEIPADGLKELNALKSIFLPDVTKIGMNALSRCVHLEEICAPNVSTIDERAFAGFIMLEKVTLGELTDVRGEANSGGGIFDDDNWTPYIDLYLPKNQEVMKGEFDENSNQYIWKPTGEKYFASPDYDNGIFLGYQFNSVKSWE